MSAETVTDLNSGNVLIGFEEKRGKAWWYRKGLQNGKPNHYVGGVPVADVIERLFYWDALEGSSEVTAISPNGVLVVQDTKNKAILRSDTGEIFGYFKGQPTKDHGYKVHQYREWLVDYWQNVLGDIQIGSAGLLKLGAVAWVSLELPDNFVTPSGVEFRPFVTGTTSHDGSVSNTYFDSNLLPVCDNTLAIAAHESGQHKFKSKHTRNSAARIESHTQAMGLIEASAMQFETAVEQLIDINVNEDQWNAFLETTFPVAANASKRAKTIAMNKRGTLIQLWEADPRVSPWKGTGFGVVQAMNTAVQHEFSIRGDKTERNQLNVINGSFAAIDAKSVKVLQQIVE